MKKCEYRETAYTIYRRHGLHIKAFGGGLPMPWKECKPMDERLRFVASNMGTSVEMLMKFYGHLVNESVADEITKVR